MGKNFYDKVAKKFGNYHTDARIAHEYFEGNPEDIFKEKLISVSGKDKIALDSGCADGRFSLSIANFFLKIKAIDTSNGMLNSARKLQKEQKITNVEFIKQDLHKLSSNEEFGVIYSRRGPVDYPIFYKLLKPDGDYVEIDIDKKDAMEIKQIFGRGQNYGEWNNSRLQRTVDEITNANFRIIFAKDYSYNEYYKTYYDLDLFLQSVPIFEDYDSKKDEHLLKKYEKEFGTDKGIRLARHRAVILAQKVSV